MVELITGLLGDYTPLAVVAAAFGVYLWGRKDQRRKDDIKKLTEANRGHEIKSKIQDSINASSGDANRDSLAGLSGDTKKRGR